MSKIMHTSLMTALLDMEEAAFSGDLSPEDQEMYMSLLERENDMSKRVDELSNNLDSLGEVEQDEFYALRDTIEEIDTMRAERMSSEQRQKIIDNLSAKEDDLPAVAHMWLDTLQKVERLQKSK